MSSERVDKQWQKKGLSGYSTPAILGTLKHYGVDVDERSFIVQTKEAYPITIVGAWLRLWKGTGQFSAFPPAAAEELWKRLAPDELQPIQLVETLVGNMQALIGLRKGTVDAEKVEASFVKLEEVVKRMPTAKERRELFVTETIMSMSGTMESLDMLAEGLAKEGHVAQAERFVGLEEQLFPVRTGISRALVQAAKGEREPAVKSLAQIANDAQRDDYGRLAAIDGLLHLDAAAEAKAPVFALLDHADQLDDPDLYEQLHNRFHGLIEALPEQRAELKAGVHRTHEGMERHGIHAHDH